MVEVCLRFLGVGYNNHYQPTVKVYDEKNCKIYDGVTFNGKIKLCLEKNKLYRIVAFFCGEKICQSFFLKKQKIYSFIFSNGLYDLNIPDQKNINLSLTDFFYKNLPIEKGELVFLAKSVNITNGTGSIDLINGDYTVTADVNGYDSSSLNPSSISVVEGTNNYNFTISATGTLTIHVTEDGTDTGTPVVGATFIRTDGSGNEYGIVITSDSNGDAVFNNVPFSATNAPVIYFKQTASDGNHEFSSAVNNTSLTTNTSFFQIQNALGSIRTISLTDANYANLPVESGTLELNN